MATIHPILSSKPYHVIRTDLHEQLALGAGFEERDEILLSEHGWTLHEFDFTLNRVVFLDVGADCELFTASFSYQRQITSANRVAMLSFDKFLALAQKLNRPKPFVHLFNIGHCGSTLLHQVINESGAAWSLSEPKFTYDIAFNRAMVSDARRIALADAGLRFLSLLPKLNERETLVLKHFSQGMKVLETWNKASPDATNLFLYRDAYSHANSRFGYGQRKGRAPVLAREDRMSRWIGMSADTPVSFLDGLFDLEAPDVRFEDLAAVAWAMMIKDYHAAKANGMVIHPFSYPQLNQERRTTVSEIFKICRIPPSNVDKALAAFNRDSHEGEESSRDRPVEKLPIEARSRIDTLLRHPRLQIDPKIVL